MLQSTAFREMVNHRQRQSLNNKLSDGYHNKSHCCNAGTFANIACHHATQRRIRDIVERVGRHQQYIAHCGIQSHMRLILNSRIIESQDIEQAERHQSPQHPRTELTPSGVSTITKKTYGWINNDSR